MLHSENRPHVFLHHQAPLIISTKNFEGFRLLEATKVAAKARPDALFRCIRKVSVHIPSEVTGCVIKTLNSCFIAAYWKAIRILPFYHEDTLHRFCQKWSILLHWSQPFWRSLSCHNFWSFKAHVDYQIVSSSSTNLTEASYLMQSIFKSLNNAERSVRCVRGCR